MELQVIRNRWMSNLPPYAPPTLPCSFISEDGDVFPSNFLSMKQSHPWIHSYLSRLPRVSTFHPRTHRLSWKAAYSRSRFIRLTLKPRVPSSRLNHHRLWPSTSVEYTLDWTTEGKRLAWKNINICRNYGICRMNLFVTTTSLVKVILGLVRAIYSFGMGKNHIFQARKILHWSQQVIVYKEHEVFLQITFNKEDAEDPLRSLYPIFHIF